MKKTLLLFACIAFAQFAKGQTLFADDFSTYTLGNIGTDVTGVTPGQGNYYTTSTNGVAPTTTTNSDNSNLQVIVENGDHGQVLQVVGPNGDKGSRFMWQPVDAVWAARTTGNDILEVEYDLFTGDPTASVNNMRIYVYDSTPTAASKILAGFTFATGSKVLQGVTYYDATAQTGGQIANYGFYLGLTGTTPSNLVLPANTWVRIGVSYDYNTGIVKFKGPGFNPSLGTTGIQGAAAMTNPNQVDIVASSGTNTAATPPVTNTTAATVRYDNIVMRASSTDTLLGTAQFGPVAVFSAYPNPATDFINLSDNVSMRSFEIVDLNGRVIKSAKLDNVTEESVDISSLASGMYLLNVETDNGKVSKKIFKN
jgi:hypothetical protein